MHYNDLYLLYFKEAPSTFSFKEKLLPTRPVYIASINSIQYNIFISNIQYIASIQLKHKLYAQ